MPHHDGLPCPSMAYPCAVNSARGSAHPTNWGQLRRALTIHSRPRAAEKGRAPCWAPHRLDDSGRRKAVHVVSVHALVLDYDDGLDVSGAMDVFSGFERCAYSTFSAAPGVPKCRLILPLAEPVAGSIWSAVYRLLLRDLGKNEQAADPKCIDPSRLYLLPCHGPVEVADYAEGSLIDLAPYVERAEMDRELAKIAAAQRAATAAHRAVAARQWAERSGDGDLMERRARAALRTEPRARQAVADDLRAKVADRDGSRIAHGIPCPSCARPDVWFVIDPRGAWSARCNHANTCGWHGQLADLLATHGLSLARYGAL